ncbi:MAG: shikimate dehydrogenase family protein [Chitinophagaceae bacterium]
MRLFALIGYPLTHSFSQKYFTEKFQREHILDAEFHLVSLENIHELQNELLAKNNLKGFAITIPHKKNILPFLHETTVEVAKMGACNCVKVENGKLIGHNTDVNGFEQSLIKQLQPHHKKALVLGTGGASAAVEYALHKLGINYTLVSRNNTVDNCISYEAINEQLLQEYTLIINTTPLGTYPKVDEAPALPYEFITDKHYLFDLVYNPSETLFLQKGKRAGAATQNGYEMLVIQAEENWKIWNS